MTIRTRNKITEKDMINVAKIGIPRGYNIMSVLVAVIGIIISIKGFSRGQNISSTIILISALLLNVWVFWYMPMSRGKKQYARKMRVLNGKEMIQNLDFYNNHAELISNGRLQIKLKYNDIRMTKETDDMFMLIFGQDVVMIVKKDGFTEGTLEDLKEKIAPYMHKEEQKKK